MTSISGSAAIMTQSRAHPLIGGRQILVHGPADANGVGPILHPQAPEAIMPQGAAAGGPPIRPLPAINGHAAAALPPLNNVQEPAVGARPQPSASGSSRQVEESATGPSRPSEGSRAMDPRRRHMRTANHAPRDRSRSPVRVRNDIYDDNSSDNESGVENTAPTCARCRKSFSLNFDLIKD